MKICIFCADKNEVHTYNIVLIFFSSQCFLVPMDQSKCPIQFNVTVPKQGCMRDLCKSMASMVGINSNNLIVTDVYNHKFNKIYKPDEGLRLITIRNDIFV